MKQLLQQNPWNHCTSRIGVRSFGHDVAVKSAIGPSFQANWRIIKIRVDSAKHSDTVHETVSATVIINVFRP
jgi:hypothetical protein